MSQTPEQGIDLSVAFPLTAPPQIVVTSQHAELVAAELEHLRVGIPSREEARELDLVLMDLDLTRTGHKGSGRLSLDQVFDRLYGHFEETYGQWVPTFGKNRNLASVIPQHQTVPGGDGEPEPVREADVVEQSSVSHHAGTGVRVALADTAVSARSRLWGHVVTDGEALLASKTDGLSADAGHGTFVAGRILEAAPAATVYLHRVLDVPPASEPGPSRTDSWTVARRLVRLARDNAHVINLSLGCRTVDGHPPLVFARALERLGPDVVVVAAAGNFGKHHKSAGPVWPAAFDRVVAVGATDEKGVRPDYSPKPEDAPWVDVQAPGHHVVSLFPEGELLVTKDDGSMRPEKFDGFARWSGTSFAAAHVTGLIAARTRPGSRGPWQAFHTLIKEANEAGSRRDGRPWLV
jgi:membrane-anchored mycosin MYCP